MIFICFSSKSYNKDSFTSQLPEHYHSLTYFIVKLDNHTSALVKEHDAICIFINDYLSEKVLEKLSDLGIKKNHIKVCSTQSSR